MELFLRVHAHSCRNSHVCLERLFGLAFAAAESFSIEPQARGCPLDPMHHDQRYDVFVGKSIVAIHPVVELLHEPSQQSEGGITERESQCLRPRLLLFEVATLIYFKVPSYFQGVSLELRIQDPAKFPANIR